MNPASLCLKCFAEVWHILRAHKSFLSSIQIHTYIHIFKFPRVKEKQEILSRTSTTHNYNLISTTKTNENSRLLFDPHYLPPSPPSIPKTIESVNVTQEHGARKIGGEGKKTFEELKSLSRGELNARTRVDFRRSASLTLQIRYTPSQPLFAKANFTLQCKFQAEYIYSPLSSLFRLGFTVPLARWPNDCYPTGVKIGGNRREACCKSVS